MQKPIGSSLQNIRGMGIASFLVLLCISLSFFQVHADDANAVIIITITIIIVIVIAIVIIIVIAIVIVIVIVIGRALCGGLAALQSFDPTEEKSSQ